MKSHTDIFVVYHLVLLPNLGILLIVDAKQPDDLSAQPLNVPIRLQFFRKVYSILFVGPLSCRQHLLTFCNADSSSYL